MIRDVVGSADAMLGESVARSVVAHHRRRLERVGWSRAVDPPEGLWAEGDPPPRGGCSLEVLIDGEEALPRIADEIAAARSHVWLAGWQFAPVFALRRDGSSQRSCATCWRSCRSGLMCSVLAWAGAPLPVFPTFASRGSSHARRTLPRNEHSLCARRP